MTFKEFLKEVELSVPLTTVIPNGAFGAMPLASFGDMKPQKSILPLRSGGHLNTPYFKADYGLGLPTVTKTTHIKFIDDKRNPIFIHCTDGTRLYIPYDDYKRINVEPAVGKAISVVFQRRPDDKSINYSQIQDINVF